MQRSENTQIQFDMNRAYENEQKEMNGGQTYQNMDYNNLLPQSLMNDLNNLVLDEDESMAGNDLDDLNAEEFEGNDQNRFYSHYTQSIGVNQSNRNVNIINLIF